MGEKRRFICAEAGSRTAMLPFWHESVKKWKFVMKIYIAIYANPYKIYADVKSNIKQQEIKDLVAASYKLL